LINKVQIATKQVDNFDERINQLKAERETLVARYGEVPRSVTSPLAGYFIDDVDGYESLLYTDMLEDLTPEKLESIMNTEWLTVEPDVIGKIADDYRWHFVCTVTAEEAERLEDNKIYRIYFPYSETESIDARLIKLTPSSDGSEYLLTFRCSYMVSDLASFRSQPMIIEVRNFTGLGINQDSIVYVEKVVPVTGEDGIIREKPKIVPGVYIVWGYEVKFRQINEIYRDGDTVVCSIESTRGWLKMFDDVIINTENVYEGKIINIS